VEIKSNLALRVLPIALTDAMITTEIPAAGQSRILARDGLSANDGEFNRSTQHFILNGNDGVYGDGSKLSSGVHYGRKNGALGSLAAGVLKAIGRAFGKRYASVASTG